MNLYELHDCMDDTPRWHLGKVTTAEGEAVPLSFGAPLQATSLSVAVTDSGPSLKYSETAFGWSIISDSLKSALSLSPSDVQIAQCKVDGMTGYNLLNPLRAIRCVDEQRSVFKKWTLEDHRKDLVGKYHYIYKLVIDQSKVPAGVHIFRVWGWEVALIVSETMKQAMEAAGCHGAVFVPVELS